MSARAFFLLIVFSLTFTTQVFAAQEGTNLAARLAKGQDPKERAATFLKTFQNGCFENFWNREDLNAFAKSYFKPLAPGSAEASDALYAVSAQAGDVWYGNFPEGSLTMAIEPNSACHVFGSNVDAAHLQTEFKNWSSDLKVQLTSKQISYKKLGRSPAGMEIFEIDIFQPENSALIAMTASISDVEPTTAILSIRQMK